MINAADMVCAFQKQLDEKDKEYPAWVITLILVVSFGLAIWISQEYGDWLAKVRWSIAIGIFGGIVFAGMFYRWAQQPNTFDPLDMFLDPVTRRVSPWRVYIFVTFAVGIWILGQWTIGKVPEHGDQIIWLYGTILTGLVAKLASGEWADVKANRQPSVADEPELPSAPPTPPIAPAKPSKKGDK